MYLRGDTLWWLDADGGVPLSWWQDRHLVQKFIYPSQQVTSVLCLVGYIMEDLVPDKRTEENKLTAFARQMLIFNLFCEGF